MSGYYLKSYEAARRAYLKHYPENKRKDNGIYGIHKDVYNQLRGELCVPVRRGRYTARGVMVYGLEGGFTVHEYVLTKLGIAAAVEGVRP